MSDPTTTTTASSNSPATTTTAPAGTGASTINSTIDAIADAFVSHAMPLISADRELQRAVGDAAGAAIARELHPLAVLVTLAAWVGAGALVWIAVRASSEGDER